jgi:hypothetical protein
MRISPYNAVHVFPTFSAALACAFILLLTCTTSDRNLSLLVLHSLLLLLHLRVCSLVLHLFVFLLLLLLHVTAILATTPFLCLIVLHAVQDVISFYPKCLHDTAFEN